MYKPKKMEKVFTRKFVGTGPSSYEKRIYWAAVSQRFRNTALGLVVMKVEMKKNTSFKLVQGEMCLTCITEIYFSNLNLKIDYPDSVSLALLHISVTFQGMFTLRVVQDCFTLFTVYSRI